MDNKILYTAKFSLVETDKRFGSWSRQTDRPVPTYPLKLCLRGGIITDVEERLKVMINSSCGLSGQLMEKIQYFSIHHFFFFLQYLKIGLGLKIYPLHQKVHSNHPTQSPVLKGHLFLYCHMSCTSFMRSFVLKDHFFFVPKVTS